MVCSQIWLNLLVDDHHSRWHGTHISDQAPVRILCPNSTRMHSQFLPYGKNQQIFDHLGRPFGLSMVLSFLHIVLQAPSKSGPISTVSAKEEWKKAQYKVQKDMTSNTIIKIIP